PLPDHLSCGEGPYAEYLLGYLDAAALAASALPARRQDPVTGVDQLAQVELIIVPGANPRPERSADTVMSPPDAAVGEIWWPKPLNVFVEALQSGSIVAELPGAVDRSHHVHVLLRHRLPSIPAACPRDDLVAQAPWALLRGSTSSRGRGTRSAAHTAGTTARSASTAARRSARCSNRWDESPDSRRYLCCPGGCGGIGRRAVFRWRWANARGGSSPLSRIAPGGVVAGDGPTSSPRSRQRLVARIHDGERRVHLRDLEQPQDGRVRAHQGQRPARARDAAQRVEQHAEPGRVDEPDFGEVDDDRGPPLGDDVVEPLGELRRGGEVDLAADADDRGLLVHLLD